MPGLGRPGGRLPQTQVRPVARPGPTWRPAQTVKTVLFKNKIIDNYLNMGPNLANKISNPSEKQYQYVGNIAMLS